MFLIIITVLVIGQMYLEYVVVKALHLESFNKKFILGNLAFSIVMSVGFGMLFPAAGMTIAAAGLISTILSQPMYHFTEWYIANVKPSLVKGRKAYNAHKAEIHQTGADVVTMVALLLYVFAIPIKILRAAANLVRRMQGKQVTPSTF